MKCFIKPSVGFSNSVPFVASLLIISEKILLLEYNPLIYVAVMGLVNISDPNIAE